MEDIQVICPYCGRPAEWVSHKIIYGKAYGKNEMVWMCKPCKAWVGCHQNTKRPLGILANKELRQWRTKAHEAMDPLWQSGYITRKELYSILNRVFKHEIHIGGSDLQTCKDVIRFAQTFKKGARK